VCDAVFPNAGLGLAFAPGRGPGGERRRAVVWAADEAAPDRHGDPERHTMPCVMQRWLSPRALLLHTEFFLVVSACAVATVWQAKRALSGHGLSWFYTFEWPILAGIAVAAWWHLIHETAEARAARRQKREEVEPGQRQAEW
jgi:hypothetical protein